MVNQLRFKWLPLSLGMRFHKPQPLVHSPRDFGEQTGCAGVVEFRRFTDGQARLLPEAGEGAGHGFHMGEAVAQRERIRLRSAINSASAASQCCTSCPGHEPWLT